MEKTILSKITKITGALAILTAIGMLTYFLLVDNVEIYNKRGNKNYKELTDYTVQKVVDENAPAGVIEEYTFHVQDSLETDTWIAFYLLHQYAEVYVGDELIYSLMPSEANKIGKTIGCNWVMVPIYQSDAGKDLRIEIIPAYDSFVGRKIDFLEGSALEIYREQLKANLLQLALGVLAIIVGFLFVVIAIHSKIIKQERKNVFIMGLCAFLLGLWRVSDTEFTPFIFPEKPMFWFYTSLVVLMLGALPLIRTTQKRFKNPNMKVFNLSCTFVSTICLIELIVQLLNIVDLRQNLILIHIVLLLSGAFMVGCVFYDAFFIKEEKETIGKILPIVFTTGIVLDLMLFYLKDSSAGLVFTILAFLVYIILSEVLLLRDYLTQKNRLKEQELKMAEERVFIMLSQIQPHFIFNVLGAIYHLCDKEVEKAKEAIDLFSTYLRKNLDSLKRESLAPFEEELRHVQIYLELEKMRFEDELNVVYDIKATEFLLPILTVQPLVENAVKHGVGKALEGGTVTIATEESVEYYEIRISDDGIGFDPNEPHDDGKTHVGIANVRSRLATRCNATLEIQSAPGEGTVAIIRLPKESEEQLA